MANLVPELRRHVENIQRSGLGIYDHINVGQPGLWLPAPDLEKVLDASLRGTSLAGLPLRTRSKIVKEAICRALGYPVPKSFKKTKPRFPGQDFDTYVQKSNNLQVWNEELSPTRRYVIIRVTKDGVIARVRVITGESLANFDTTGTLTQKYQARLIVKTKTMELVSPEDTQLLKPFTNEAMTIGGSLTPTSFPQSNQLMPIQVVFTKLSKLLGKGFPDSGCDQERNRGAALHRLICSALGYSNYRDDGQFPDVRHQLLEVKLQTSPTIDLGLVRPDSIAPLDSPQLEGVQVRHCDVRYALFYGETNGTTVKLTRFFLTTGEDFFTRFPQFQGKVLNKKLQIPLPSNFFF